MNYQKISEGLTFLMNDKRITIVYGVLKSLGVSPRRDDYDDFVQDASIIFAQAYADFLQEKDEVENERDLMCFAYQRMRWRLLDRLRRQQLECFLFNYTLDNEEDDHDYNETMVDHSATAPFAHLENSDFLNYLYHHCPRVQQRYLIAKLNHHLSDLQIADEYSVSRAAVSQWRRGVITRAHQLRAKMKGEFWGENVEKHEIDHQAKWLHIKYDGEDRDDECVNELSIYQNADEPELQMLVSNIDFDNISHDNTFALTKEDARVLIEYLKDWIN